MRVRISRISILQSSKIMTALYVVLGAFYSLFGFPRISLFGIPMMDFNDGQQQMMPLMYVVMPVLMAIFGFIGFVIVCALYNLLALFLGGFEYEMTEIPEVE